jgi:hypothetical protein
VTACTGTGANGLVRTIQLTVPTKSSSTFYEVFSNQESIRKQVIDKAGNPLNWSSSVGSFFSS